ncbi:MAG: carboxypeptidase-like regulatory domain-containing protein, partial [Bacteroidales bacterium]|nr:carboxypeptidase-like regulatory domain-containing protein [Bacteroidales bacterium]
MKKLSVFLAGLLLAGITLVQAQTVRITGTVTSSEDGMPMPGVSVVVQGTTIGITTNADGKYELNVPATAQTLTFSFVGYKTVDVPIAGRSVIDVAMETEAVQMGEVVVTALGITRQKKALGYTVQDVKGDDLVKANNPNVMTALSGKVAGVEIRQSSGMPGAPSTILIRGARSFSGNNQPLYVVDGMPIASNADYGQNVTGAAYSNRALDIDP